MALKIETKADFSIKIDFDKHSEHPARIFEAMSSLINSFQELDRDLIKAIDSKDHRGIGGQIGRASCRERV